MDIDDQDTQRVERGYDRVSNHEKEDEWSSQVRPVLEHPAVPDHGQRSEPQQRNGDLETSRLDGEFTEVLLLAFRDRHTKTCGVASIVPIDDFPLRESCDETSKSDRDVDQAELDVVEAVDICEDDGDAGSDDIEAGVHKAHEDEKEAGLFLTEDGQCGCDGVLDMQATALR